MPNLLHDAFFAPQADRDTPFLRDADGGSLSHAAFHARANQIANVLVEAGLAPGDRLAVQVEKSAENLALYAAAVRAGVVYLPLNTAYTGEELAYFVRDSGAGLLVCDPAREEALSALAPRTLTLDADGRGTLADRADAASDAFTPVDRAEDDLAGLLYTSGTTGRSKGAMMSHRNLVSNAQTLAELWRFTDDDTLLHALPIYHTHGLFVATNVTLAAGGSMVLLPKFDADQLVRLMPRATALMGVPTFYTRLLDTPGFDRASCANMRLFISGSAPLLAETHRRFEDRTGHRILERYGMTETNMNTSNPYDGERRAGTVGFPLPGVELRIMEGEAPVADGEIGGIEVRGPNVFQGYWQMPDKTAEDLRPDGWFRTGDLGTRDADGYVTIVGRGKDLVITGGLNVYPKEVEDVLDAQPGVLESAVIGVPDPDMGEAVVAVLVPEAGATPDLDAIAKVLHGALARFKHPKRFELVEALPRNTMGKVQKTELRARFG